MPFRMSRALPGILTLFTLFLLTAALTAPASAPPTITVTAKDFAFEAPDRMPAGAVTVHLVNHGQVMHHAQLVRIEGGHTLEELVAAEKTGDFPDWAVWEGGPGVVAPGGEATVTLDLEPGTYYWLCFIETGGQPHLDMGMVQRVTVDGADDEALPEADRTIVMDDYSYEIDEPLTPGRHVIRVENRASQPHEMVLVKLAPGKSVDDVLAFLDDGRQGDPPGRPIGGMQALTKGEVANVQVYLDPGRYGMICFVPDAGDGAPHFAHGMVDEFTVE